MTYDETRFMAAMERHLQLVEELGQEHPETMKTMQVALDLAPPEIQEQLTAKAKELGLMPKTPYGLVNGQPVYRLEDIAKTLGLSMEEAQASVEEMLREREALGLSNEGLTVQGKVEVLH